jgi:hypothetical protein
MYIHFDSDNYNIYYNSTDTSSDDETSIIMVDQDDDETVETDIDDDIVDNGYNTDDGYNTDEGIEYDSIHNEDSQHFTAKKKTANIIWDFVMFIPSQTGTCNYCYLHLYLHEHSLIIRMRI